MQFSRTRRNWPCSPRRIALCHVLRLLDLPCTARTRRCQLHPTQRRRDVWAWACNMNTCCHLFSTRQALFKTWMPSWKLSSPMASVLLASLSMFEFRIQLPVIVGFICCMFASCVSPKESEEQLMSMLETLRSSSPCLASVGSVDGPATWMQVIYFQELSSEPWLSRT